MNCLQKAWAIRVEDERVLLPKVIGWLGGEWVDFPDRDLKSDHSLDGLD